MNDAPVISIIIPAYNCASFLADTLDSILAQSFTRWECIVVNDGSTDGTAALVKCYAEADSRIHLLHQGNAGPCVARNHGYQSIHPKSRYVTFMDGDDLWLPDALKILHYELERVPACIGSHGLAEFIDADSNPLMPGWFSGFGRRRLGYDGKKIVEWDINKPTCFATLVTSSVLFPPGLVLTKREIYEKTGLFDKGARLAEDWDMLVRLSRHGDFCFINKVILSYRRHSANVGTTSGVPAMAWSVRCKTFFSPENTEEQQKILKGGWRAYQIEMIQERLRSARQHSAERHYFRAVNMLARIPVHCYRYMQGHPVPSGL